MTNLPPLDPSHVSTFVSRLDPKKVKTAALAALERTKEWRAVDLLPPDERPTPPPKR